MNSLQCTRRGADASADDDEGSSAASQDTLMDHVDGFLGDGVEGGDGLCVRFKASLHNDQVRELGRDVDVRTLKGSILKCAEPIRSRGGDGSGSICRMGAEVRQASRRRSRA